MVTNESGRQELWVLTSSFQRYMSGSLHPNETNFRIQAAYIDELVRGTKCDCTFHNNNNNNFYPPQQHHHHYHHSTKISTRPSILNKNFEPINFPSWRSWYREEEPFASKFHQTSTSFWFHHFPSHDFHFDFDDFSFPYYHNYHHHHHHYHYDPSYFSRYMGDTKYIHSFVKWPAFYSYYIDHGWWEKEKKNFVSIV